MIWVYRHNRIKETQTRGDKMTLSQILAFAVESAPKLSRAQVAADNYSFLTSKRAPDNLPESWADKFNLGGQK